MKKQLTDGYLRTLKAPKAGRIEIMDAACRGLCLRVTENDIRTWSFRFTNGQGRVKRALIGPYPNITLAKARLRADGLRAEVADGGDPALARRQERSDAQTKTFASLAQTYLQMHAAIRKRPRSAEEDRRNLDKHVLPYWKDRPYSSIKRPDVVELLDRIVKAGTPGAANTVHSLISKIFSFALKRGMIDSHPATRMDKPGGKLAPRGRVLSDEEIKLFWHGVIEPPVSRPVGLALRLSLLLGLRASEASELARAELEDLDDPENAAAHLPRERTKNNQAHWLPLLPLARATIEEALALTREGSAYVFSGRGDEDAPVDGHVLGVAMRRFTQSLKGRKEAAAATWRAMPPTPHDLRRTLRTRLAKLGIADEHANKVMNHQPRDVGNVHYNKYKYASEKRLALAAWSDLLDGIVNGTKRLNVVPIQKRRRA
jgi:integrase